MGQITACSTLGPACCASADKGDIEQQGAAILRLTLSAEQELVAYLRRRAGPDCDFGESYVELFGSRDPVGETKFESVLKDRGAGQFQARDAFRTLDVSGKGAVGAAEFEEWQETLEKKETECLREWRDWMRRRFATPSAAYSAMGKGEGDVITELDFGESLKRLGFKVDNPVELFRCVDKDFSGEVTFAEFKSAMRSVGLPRVKERIDAPKRSSVSKQEKKPPKKKSVREDADEDEESDHGDEDEDSRQPARSRRASEGDNAGGSRGKRPSAGGERRPSANGRRKSQDSVNKQKSKDNMQDRNSEQSPEGDPDSPKSGSN